MDFSYSNPIDYCLCDVAPYQLMWILDSGLYENAMKWSNNGESFVVLSRDEVGQKVLFEIEGRQVEFSEFSMRVSHLLQ